MLSREGNGTASRALLDAVSVRLNADEIRPLTDFVTVKSAIINDYSVTAELEIPDGPDAGEVLENAKNTLMSYAPAGKPD
nr:baseplate J/gp47 family protein [Escherichia coli]